MRLESRFSKDMSSLEEIFEFLREFVEAEQLGSDIEFCVTLLVEEIFTNMVKYNTGSGNDVAVGIERDGGQVVVQLTDSEVEAFDPESIADVDIEAPLSKRRPGGLGLHLVRSLADKVVFEYGDRELKVVLYKNVT